VTLRGREDSWRASGHNDQDRIFLAAKWQIDRKTVLKAEYEQADINRFVPRPFFGNDNTSIWDANGQPIFNDFSATVRPRHSRHRRHRHSREHPSAIPAPPTSSACRNVPAVIGSSSATASPTRKITVSSPTPSTPTGGSSPTTSLAAGSNPTATPEANWVRGGFKVHNFSTFLQREIAKGMNAEIAFNRQHQPNRTRNLASWNHYGVSADTNRYLPNGQLKPVDNLYYFDVSPDRRPAVERAGQSGPCHVVVRKGLPRLGQRPPRRPRRNERQQIPQPNPATILVAQGPVGRQRRRVQPAHLKRRATLKSTTATTNSTT